MTALAKLNDRFSETEIDDEVVIMRLDTGDMLSLTDSAARIWRLIDGMSSQDQIVTELAGQFEGAEEDIRSQVGQFLDQLRLFRLIA